MLTFEHEKGNSFKKDNVSKHAIALFAMFMAQYAIYIAQNLYIITAVPRGAVSFLDYMKISGRQLS